MTATGLATSCPDAVIEVAGVALVPDPSGALLWPEERALLIADMHLEKGSALARRGSPLPPYDTAATLARLAAVIARHAPRLVISLGDAFHDRGAGERMAREDCATLAALMRGRTFVWISGNHDPSPPEWTLGERFDALGMGRLTLRHEPFQGEALGEIAGHLHPVARVATRGRTLRRRCFATDRQRLVMPAFGAYAGGLDLTEPALRGLFLPGRLVAHCLGEAAVHPIAFSALRWRS